MKKVLSVFVVMMIIVSGVFATSTPIQQQESNASGTADVTLQFTLTPSQMAFYSFGFSDGTNLANLQLEDVSLPDTAAAELTMDYDPVTSKATISTGLHAFYKVRTVDTVGFTLSIPAKMSNGSENVLDWEVKIGKIANNKGSAVGFDQTSISSSGTTSAKAAIKAGGSSAADYYKAGSFALTVETAEVPMSAEQITYTGNLQLTISTN